MANNEQQPEPDPAKRQGDEPHESWSRWITSSMDRIVDRLDRRRDLLLALFLLFTLGVVAVAAHGATNWYFAVCLLFCFGAALALTLAIVFFSERRKRQKSSVRYKIGFAAATLAATFVSGTMLDHFGAFATLLPELYDDKAAAAAVLGHYDALNGFLQSSTDNARLENLEKFSSTMTEPFRQRNLPKGAPDAIASEHQSAESQIKLKEFTDTYRSWYGRANGAIVEAIIPAPWQRKQSDSSKHMVHLLAVVRYTGQFIPNHSPRHEKWKIPDVVAAYTSPSSRQAADFVQWLTGCFEYPDKEKATFSISNIRVRDLFEENAFDVLPYRDPTAFGKVRDDAYKFGNEVALHSIRLERDAGGSSKWKVAEVGRWGLKRVFTEEESIPSPPSSAGVFVDEVPYVPQSTPALCQSACLQMVWEYSKKGQEFEGGQEKIRRDLSTYGKALSHDARAKWLNKELPSSDADRAWSWTYEPALPLAAQKISESLTGKTPVILSTRLTADGHVIVLTGIWMDNKGEIMVRAHDPWGRFNFSQRSFERGDGFGKDVTYPLRELYVSNRWWRQTDGKKQFAKYVVGSEEWIPSVRELQSKGSVALSVDKDWEFVSLRPSSKTSKGLTRPLAN
jgi:hypothetical protein